jgi:hypothetical protein
LHDKKGDRCHRGQACHGEPVTGPQDQFSPRAGLTADASPAETHYARNLADFRQTMIIGNSG